MFKKTLAAAALLASSSILAEVPISGTVASKCVITTDTPGIYGNPTPNILSTDLVDGGIPPVIRFDIISANNYKAAITIPNEFSASPGLTDTVNWEGSVIVGEVTDPGMAAFETNKRIYNNTTEFDLTIAGSVWFDIASIAKYGFDKAFPSGTYSSVVEAECVAL